MFERFLIGELYVLAMVFARMGSALMLLPGFGERAILERARLLLSLLIAFAVAPVVAPYLPAAPSDFAVFVALFVSEIGVGLFIGFIARLAMSALESAGQLINFQIGLAAATVFNPMMQENSSLPGVFLFLLVMTVMFQMDLHHVTLRAAIDSYQVFTPGALPPIGDFTKAAWMLLSKGFALALQFSGPFILMALILNLGMGVISRMQPQLQVFFLLLPVQIVLGLFLISLLLNPAIHLFLEFYLSTYGSLMQKPAP